MVVLVTGAAGQVGQMLESISDQFAEVDFVFCNRNQFDITDSACCRAIFKKYRPDYCLNLAAYTAVDRAEQECECAAQINVAGVQNLIDACLQWKATLIHLSTDFVFDGAQNWPYTETDAANPKSIYGQTKWQSEQLIASQLEQYFIFRTSWVFSNFGRNFVKTMLRLADNNTPISVVADQFGTPTHAKDLCQVLLLPVLRSSKAYGLYHFSGAGSCSWYDFAVEVFRVNKREVRLLPVATKDYPTAALRPAYSVLSKEKLEKEFNVQPRKWQTMIAEDNN